MVSLWITQCVLEELVDLLLGACEVATELAPNSLLTKPKGLARKSNRFLAFCFLLLLYPSSLHRVMSFFCKMFLSLIRASFRSSLSLLYCFLSEQSSCYSC